MRRRFFEISLTILAALTIPVSASGDDWPQWRGQQRDGRSAETGLLAQWPEAGPPLAWQAKGMGAGYSSVAVVGDRIFTTGDLGETQYVIAVKSGGGELWKTAIGPAWEDQYLGARSTPTVDGDRVYAVSTEGDVVCLSAEDGSEHWRRNLPKEFGGALMQAMGKYDWKFSESPLLDGGRVIVTPGAPDAALVALDKTDGKEIWRATIPELGPAGADGVAYSSVVVSEGGGVRQYVQFLGRGLVGVEAGTGRFLWGYNRVANKVANVATPIIDGNHVFASSAYETGAALVELSGTDAGVEAEEIYFLDSKTLQNHHGGLVLHDGYVYAGTGHKKGFPLAVEKTTGKVAWGPIRNEGRGSAAVAYADGHLYFRYENGLMVLIEATPEEYREKGSFEIPDVKQFSWSHPVISGGVLYLREQDSLYAYDVKAK